MKDSRAGSPVKQKVFLCRLFFVIDGVARHINTNLLKMASSETKVYCVLGYVMFTEKNYFSVVMSFCSYMTEIVYRTNAHNVMELKHRIQAATEAVDQGMLQRSWMELEYRLDIILATKRSHVKLYQKR
ncbi:hypothetical protein AVEN_45579-1 [Araneus ventricosus]|uniref:Uncharacterized protein n=1 Tax=Araneus ventricosus TaxID=182803 RepID=A0A4Y2UI09_ARAVE|nr:hypothetical protein AVEN_45579-1 [Araneus ventricosus]